MTDEDKPDKRRKLKARNYLSRLHGGEVNNMAGPVSTGAVIQVRPRVEVKQPAGW